MERVCFTMQVRKERLAEYLERHRHVWPTMLDLLTQAGWRNYTLFHDPEGFVVGYLECEDFDAARAQVAASDVARQWSVEMAELLAPGTDAGAVRLVEYFHHDG